MIILPLFFQLFDAIFDLGNFFKIKSIDLITFFANKKLSVNNLCQLRNFKNVYIIDGSVFDFKINKYLPYEFFIGNRS